MMRRRTFLSVAAATSLGAPAAAKAAVWPDLASWKRALPQEYAPVDAPRYRHPKVLRADQVDELIWPAVRRINRSGWAWTLESCQGHHAWSALPLLRLACHHGDAARMLGLLHRSALIGTAFTKGPSGTDPNKVEVYRHVPAAMDGWFEARVTIDGPEPLHVFERFADAVNTGRVR